MQHTHRPQGFTCPSTGKKGYPTWVAAEKARRWLKSHSKNSDGWTQMETYGPAECCGQYHHTSCKARILVDV